MIATGQVLEVLNLHKLYKQECFIRNIILVILAAAILTNTFMITQKVDHIGWLTTELLKAILALGVLFGHLMYFRVKSTIQDANAAADKLKNLGSIEQSSPQGFDFIDKSGNLIARLEVDKTTVMKFVGVMTLLEKSVIVTFTPPLS